MTMEKEKLVSLVTAAQNGDAEATNELFNAFYNDLYYFALKTIKDDEIALDVTQDAFVEIINTLGNLKEPAAFVTWAKQITYHQCTRHFRKKKDVLVDEDEEGNTIFDDIKEENSEFIPDEALDQNDFKKTILSILDELSEEQRSAVMMYYFDEMSVGQIAEIQGVSAGTVKSRLNYARKAIKTSVEEYEKKNNIKLHAIPFFPFFQWLFKGSFSKGVPAKSAKIIAEGVSASTGATVVASASASGVVTTATTTTAVGLGAKIASIPVTVKIIAAAVAATVVVGGAATAVILSNGNEDNRPTDTQGVVSSVQDEVQSDETITDDESELVLEGIIPEGCTYTLTDGTVLTAGQSFPETCTAGDVVAYGDYLYGYECFYMGHEEDAETDWYLWKDGFDSGDSGVIESDVFDAWSVMVKDQTQASYGEVVSKINGKPIKTLYATYYYCENMTEAPKIPSTITSMTASYYGCTSLTTAPVIPSGVERIMVTFIGCTALSGDVEINATLDKSLEWYYSDTFSETTQKINLVGATPEADLILIAKASNNRNITVNGKPVDYGDTDSDTAPDLDNSSDEQPNEQPDEQPNDSTDEKAEVIESSVVAEQAANEYVSRLVLSCLPYFSSVDGLSNSNAFWFVFFDVDKEPYYKGENADGAMYYEIPVSIFTTETQKVFGREFDFTSLNEYSPFAGSWQVSYKPTAGEDIISAVLQGGAGDDYHPEVTGFTKLNENQYQVNIAWYSGSAEKPTDENADYYYNEETGDYWIASKWEKMILESVVETEGDKTYIRTRIVSYLER